MTSTVLADSRMTGMLDEMTFLVQIPFRAGFIKEITIELVFFGISKSRQIC
jgi:hypothetical protein